MIPIVSFFDLCGYTNRLETTALHHTFSVLSVCSVVRFSPRKRMTNHGMHGIHGNEVIDRFLFCVVRVFRGSFPYVHYTALCKPFAAARQPLPAGASRLFAIVSQKYANFSQKQ